MSEIDTIMQIYRFSRQRTLGLLESIEKAPHPTAVLAWRPGAGRAHIGWQLMHIAIAEELFATERLVPGATPAWPELVPRFRGGSTPDDDVPSAALIRDVLTSSREHLEATLAGKSAADLEQIPPALAERGWTLRTVLHVLGWHEAHHQGQAHLTYNLWKATQ